MADEITVLIRQLAAGDSSARDRLFSAAYPELRKLAHVRLRGGGHSTTLGTTALVHEYYLRFQRGGELRADDRRAFFAYASRAMRSIIIDTLRASRAGRRGGDLAKVTLDTACDVALPCAATEVLRIHEALGALEEAEPRLAKVVEMRYFGGYSEAEIGDALDLTDRTVRRDWDKARLLLMALLSD